MTRWFENIVLDEVFDLGEHQFTAATGRAPSEYVLERRLERIERLLLATDMSVVAIAAATGFADANYLSKAFRRRRGMAPLEYRAAQRRASGT